MANATESGVIIDWGLFRFRPSLFVASSLDFIPLRNLDTYVEGCKLEMLRLCFRNSCVLCVVEVRI